MTRKEQLKQCRICLHRKMSKQGLICKLTHKKADFEIACSTFSIDELRKKEVLKEQKKWALFKWQQGAAGILALVLSISTVGIIIPLLFILHMISFF